MTSQEVVVDSGSVVYTVYWRTAEGALANMCVEYPLEYEGSKTHEDAILAVQDAIIKLGETWEEPMLAVIEGGKE